MEHLNDEMSEMPAFILSVFDNGADDIELAINIPEEPQLDRHASLALLYGLAILTLDRQGTLNAMIDQFLIEGPINEIDATNRITLLMMKETNDLPS